MVRTKGPWPSLQHSFLSASKTLFSLKSCPGTRDTGVIKLPTDDILVDVTALLSSFLLRPSIFLILLSVS